MTYWIANLVIQLQINSLVLNTNHVLGGRYLGEEPHADTLVFRVGKDQLLAKMERLED